MKKLIVLLASLVSTAIPVFAVTPTPTATFTPTPTATATATFTPTPSATFTPTPTPRGGSEPINVNTRTGAVKETSSHVGSIGKPFDWSGVYVLGLLKGSLTEGQIAFGDSLGHITGSGNLTWDDGDAVLLVNGTVTASIADVGSLKASGIQAITSTGGTTLVVGDAAHSEITMAPYQPMTLANIDGAVGIDFVINTGLYIFTGGEAVILNSVLNAGANTSPRYPPQAGDTCYNCSFGQPHLYFFNGSVWKQVAEATAPTPTPTPTPP